MFPIYYGLKTSLRITISIYLKKISFFMTLERTGEVAVTALSVICSDFNLRKLSSWSLWLAAAAIFMIMYEVWWIKYFRSDKEMKDFYSSFLGIPVAGASLPVTAFLLLGIYGKNILLIISTVILGIGHIGIHLSHKKEC